MACYKPINPFTDLKPGDQIAIRSLFGNLHASLKHLYHVISSKNYYYHHGVYLGGDVYEVVHFYGETSADARPCKIDLWAFVQNGEDNQLYRVDHEGEVLPINETLQKAKEVLVKDETNDKEKWPGYNIIWNNCENLASWLKIGKKVSYQAKEVVIRGGISASAASVAIIGSIAGSIAMIRK